MRPVARGSQPQSTADYARGLTCAQATHPACCRACDRTNRSRTQHCSTKRSERPGRLVRGLKERVARNFVFLDDASPGMSPPIRTRRRKERRGRVALGCRRHGIGAVTGVASADGRPALHVNACGCMLARAADTCGRPIRPPLVATRGAPGNGLACAGVPMMNSFNL